MVTITYGPKLRIWISVLDWMSFLENLPSKNLCTVHSLRGRMLMAFCFCSLHLVLIKCCESKSMCCNFLLFFCTARYSFSTKSTSCIELQFVSCDGTFWRASPTLCRSYESLFLHLFCTLNKKNMLCSSNLSGYSGSMHANWKSHYLQMVVLSQCL